MHCLATLLIISSNLFALLSLLFGTRGKSLAERQELHSSIILVMASASELLVSNMGDDQLDLWT